MTSEAVQMLRSEIEQTVERLIGLLDLVDPNPDLEPTGDDEPTLGWPAGGPHVLGSTEGDDDRELEDENDEDGGDAEWNGDEADYDGGENDAPGLIGGGLGL